MEHSANLQLPYIMPSQAQKHVTHNEAIRALDALVQLTALDRDLSAPPASPANGDRYLVAAGGTGVWAGKDGNVAAWQDGAWTFLAPRAGWLLWVADETRLLGFDGTGWIDAAVHSVNPAPLVGVNAAADATNRLAVKSPASLFDAETGDHRLTINKASAGDTASLIFQSGYSGRAEFGLAGDDDWHVKVSADGSVWTEALRVDRATGRVRLPAALPLGDENQVVTQRHVRERLTTNRTYYVRADGSDSNNGLANTSGGAFLTIQKALDAVYSLDCSIYNVTIQVGTGTYTGAVVVSGPPVGTGTITIIGDATTPSNVVIAVSGTACIRASNSARLSVRGVKVTTALYGFHAENGAILTYKEIDFGACSAVHVLAEGGGVIINSGNYAISGGTSFHWNAGAAGTILAISGATITLTGSPVFSAFARAHTGGVMQVNGNTFSGSTGISSTRYQASANGVIQTFGGGATYLPGDTGGSTASGGQYL